MNLLLIRHLWGIELPPIEALPKISALGYRGIEAPFSFIGDREIFHEALRRHDLRFIADIYTSGNSVREHLQSFAEQLKAARVFGAMLVDSQSGSDGFTYTQSLEFFREAIKIERDLGMQVAHETHRGRVFFNPWITDFVLREVPEVNLCADFSHWVCVCERLLPDTLEIIKHAAEHTVHVHARVGYEQGPQVPDPRAPEYATHLQAHESWWDLVWAAQRRKGLLNSTLTPEFGPPGYLHTLPHSNVPVANLWEICNWQAQRQAARFNVGEAVIAER